MSESNNDLNHPILNLSSQEKQVFSYLFNQADKDSLGVVTGENAVTFFEPTKLDPSTLGEIWQIADTENRGLLTKPGFCMVLRLIGHVQTGKQPTAELAFMPGPLPKFDGMTLPGVGAPALSGGNSAQPSPTTGQFPATALQPQLSGQGPIRVPPLDPQKAQQYTGLFERSGAQDGMLDGVTAKSIFERAGLPNEVLGKIWALSDRGQRGALDQTEFIVAMHLLTSMKTRAMTALPSTLPAGLYDAAARRGAPPAGPRQPPSRSGIPPQYTGSIARTQSPLTARPVGFGTPPPPMSAQTTGPQWLIVPAEKAKYDQFFLGVDKQGRGVVTGEQAVAFFSDSGLPEDTLASIWDLADIKSSGELTRDEFAVAMYLIRQQRTQNPPPLPAFLPPALVPPSLRKQQLPTQQQSAQPSTAPVFDNANNTSNISKSAADDLFGLDEPAQPSGQQPLQPQSTGASAQGASRDPFQSSQPQSPSSPQRFQPQPQQTGAGSMFKPFIPTSLFGASLQQQNTGGSQGSASGQARNVSAPLPPQSTGQQQTSSAAAQAQKSGFGGDDLLGDNETQAAESSKITGDTTELANMSSQIGNLRGQMEATQSKKQATQADLNATNAQKRDLELRLQQFRGQYETEVRTAKELETQLASSRESTKKLGQELAMLEGTYQDLSSRHQTITGQLQTDQQENASLKQKISQLNPYRHTTCN
ncbi:EF-hand [Polychaeton citri CBS 116435]|uniref:EF-hand n=1 Tax=Polychaeton citri CBS 116435 TaxID=1314669 RepID=A0A9P4UR05_9PEZI|nr:EF-hand [Polychaeton citri CBS 116435]